MSATASTTIDRTLGRPAGRRPAGRRPLDAHRTPGREAGACRPGAAIDRRPARPAAPRRTAGVGAGSTVSEATYRRRRAVVGIVLAVLVAASAVLTHDVLAGSGGVPASAAESQPARTRVTVTARPGDTLWSIAERHHGEISLTRYVDALVDLNGGAAIQAGQAVVLP